MALIAGQAAALRLDDIFETDPAEPSPSSQTPEIQPDTTVNPPHQPADTVVVTLPAPSPDPWQAGQIGNLPFEVLPFALVAAAPEPETPGLDWMNELERLPASRVQGPSAQHAQTRSIRPGLDQVGRVLDLPSGKVLVSLANETHAIAARFEFRRTGEDEPLVLLLGPGDQENLQLDAGEWTMTRTAWQPRSAQMGSQLEQTYRAQSLNAGWRYQHTIRSNDERTLMNQLR